MESSGYTEVFLFIMHDTLKWERDIKGSWTKPRGKAKNKS